jgi:uncharacterized repeat protein (TIGR01451 family)
MKVVSIIAACAMLAGAVATDPAWAAPVGPDLTITNLVPPGTVIEGQTVHYTITVSNIGGVAAIGTAVTDILPSSVGFLNAVVPAGESNLFTSGVDTWTIGTLDSMASTTLTLAVEVLVSSGTISDTAIANATNYSDVSATAIFDVSATPLPATLPLFAGGLGFVGFLTRRKKRNAQALAAA